MARMTDANDSESCAAAVISTACTPDAGQSRLPPTPFSDRFLQVLNLECVPYPFGF